MTAAGATALRCRSCLKLHLAESGRTPLQELAAPLQALAGHERFYNILDREGFRYVEEVTATPDRCLLELRNVGPKLVVAVRHVIAELNPGGADPLDDAEGLDFAAPVEQPAPIPGVTAALRTLAAWAQAERGAYTIGDVVGLADGVIGLAPDITRAWELVAGTSLRSLAKPPDEKDLPFLAEELLGQIGERRRLILTERTFASPRRTYSSLAADMGVTGARVRQLEQSASQQLAVIAAGSRYAPLRWRALTAATSATRAPVTPPWMGGLLAWLARRIQEAERRPPLLGTPASSDMG